MIDPREFNNFDDSPTNTGWIGKEHDYDEVRLTNREKYPDIDDPSEDSWNDDESHTEQDF